jgi:Ni/Co efflux regulator RcnB
MKQFFLTASSAALVATLVIGASTASNAQTEQRRGHGLDSTGAYQNRQVDRERGFDRQQGNRSYYRSVRNNHHKHKTG